MCGVCRGVVPPLMLSPPPWLLAWLSLVPLADGHPGGRRAKDGLRQGRGRLHRRKQVNLINQTRAFNLVW